jgi:hypothetical protein
MTGGRRGVLSTADLARSNKARPELIRAVLLDEARRGHVVEVAPDVWRATPLLVARLSILREVER